MRANNFEIILLAETWFNANERFIFRNFDSINRGRTDRRGGGVALLIRNGIRYKIYDVLFTANNKLEVCAAEIIFNSKPLIIVSLYKPPHITVSSEE